MTDTHPFLREIERQVNQGFYEEKKGRGLLNPDLSFTFQPSSRGYSLTITRENALYRLPDESVNTLNALLSLNAEQLFPFRKMMHDLVTILEKESKIYDNQVLLHIEKETEDGTSFRPDHDHPLFIRDAIGKFCYAAMIPKYGANDPVELSFYGPNVTEARECVGKVVLKVNTPHRLTSSLDQAVKYLEKMAGKPKFKEGDLVEGKTGLEWGRSEVLRRVTVQSYAGTGEFHEGSTVPSPLENIYLLQGKEMRFPERDLRRTE